MSSRGEEGDGDSGFVGSCGSKGWAYSASDDGRYVAFASKAGNLHPADTNHQVIQDIFVHDREKRKLSLVSAMPSGLAPELPPSIGLDACALGGAPAIRSHTPAISGNGRYVAFVSNLPLTGTEDPAAGALDQVFVRDLKEGTTELASPTWDGLPPIGHPDNDSGWSGLSISDDGRFVAFTSGVINIMEDVCPSIEIAPGSQVPVLPDCRQTYVRDRKSGETILVSKSSAGEPANFSSENPSMSGNGRYVVFTSEASNLVTGDLNVCKFSIQLGPSCDDVFIHDLRTQETELVSVSRDGTSGNDLSHVEGWTSGFQAVSDDGRFVAFHSGATDLVPANNPLYPLDVSGGYLRDRKEGRTQRVSVSSTGAALRASTQLTISDDGRYLLAPLNTLSTYSEDPLEDESHGRNGFFVHDRKTGQLDNVTRLGNPSDSPDYAPAGSSIEVVDIGGNARFVLGSQGANGVVENDTNDLHDVFVRDIGIDKLGVGSLTAPASSRRITLPSRPSFEETGMATFRDAPDDALIPAMGAEILKTKLAFRPELDDLFVRIDVERMFGIAAFTGLTPSPVIYGARIATGSGTFELRAQGTVGSSSTGGVFGLFRCAGEICTEKVALSGGFGTVGEAIVASIPLRHLGLNKGGEITNVEAFTGPGTYDLGAIRVLDAVGR
ncbi:MAG: hypothetical protein ACRDLB_14705 [Actinomycetota bacterium]